MAYHPVSLIKESNLSVMKEALRYWDGKRLTSHAWCVMFNHLHWLFAVFEKDEDGNHVYLPDILHSVKRYSARKINVNEGRNGSLWEHESFETTIRNDRHFVNVQNYIIKNPVSAGLVKNWKDWKGTFINTREEVGLF